MKIKEFEDGSAITPTGIAIMIGVSAVVGTTVFAAKEVAHNVSMKRYMKKMKKINTEAALNR